MEERPYLRTKIVEFDSKKDNAYAKLEYQGHWYEVILRKKPLVSLDLREGEVFLWSPQEDGIVRLDHVRRHPRRDDPKELEETRKIFDNLDKFMKEQQKK